jgi:NACalpha-BTF3-like transcription factor
MQEVPLDLDPAMVDNMRRESDTHGFDTLDEYVQWVLEHRDVVLNEHDVWNNPPGEDYDADLSQSPSDGLDIDAGNESSGSLEPASNESETTAEEWGVPAGEQGNGDDTEPAEDDEETPEDEDVDLPEDEEGADDDDVAAALEEIELDDEE